MDLFIDTSRKGVAMVLAHSRTQFQEIVNANVRGEMLAQTLDELLEKMSAKLEDIQRVLVTLGPGSFSGLRTGIAFAQGISFSGKRNLFGVSTLEALECFSALEPLKKAVVIRARNGFWYTRYQGEETFTETENVLKILNENSIEEVVCDTFVLETFKEIFKKKNIQTILDVAKSLCECAPLFEKKSPSLIQEANYIQPSYFEKTPLHALT